jgi:hypothetical protein
MEDEPKWRSVGARAGKSTIARAASEVESPKPSPARGGWRPTRHPRWARREQLQNSQPTLAPAFNLVDTRRCKSIIGLGIELGSPARHIETFFRSRAVGFAIFYRRADQSKGLQEWPEVMPFGVSISANVR